MIKVVWAVTIRCHSTQFIDPFFLVIYTDIKYTTQKYQKIKFKLRLIRDHRIDNSYIILKLAHLKNLIHRNGNQTNTVD